MKINLAMLQLFNTRAEIVPEKIWRIQNKILLARQWFTGDVIEMSSFVWTIKN